MAFQKFDAAAATKTHGAAEASLVEVINPFGPPLVGSTENLVRSAAAFGIGWLGRGYKDNGTFGL